MTRTLVGSKVFKTCVSSSGYDHQGTAGFSPCFHLPGFQFTILDPQPSRVSVPFGDLFVTHGPTCVSHEVVGATVVMFCLTSDPWIPDIGLAS